MTVPRENGCARLVIFDLDQTLVDLTWLHDETVHELFRRFFGVEARLTEIDFGGKSLGENIMELAAAKGIPRESARQRAGEALEAYDRIFLARLPGDASAFVLPGARELLDELSKTDHVPALYTGSSASIAQSVLANTGLDRYFLFAIYGTKAPSRSAMVELALGRAEQLTHRRFRGKDIVIVGDSVRDVECSQRFGAVGIAVATGYHTAAELRRKNPDYLFDSLKDHRAVLQAIEAGCPVRQRTTPSIARRTCTPWRRP